jgi:signal recognition particle receptor subunit beta
MTQHKIIFTGSMGAGKTTAIQAISDMEVLKTDVSGNVIAEKDRALTSLAMDYGMILLEKGEKIYLYGAPSEERLDVMWDILLTGGIGLIILIDNSSVDPFKDMRFFLKLYDKFITETAVAIGVTKMDIKIKPTIADYHSQLASLNIKPPVFEVDARVKADVSLLVRALLYSLDPGIEK